MFNRFMLFLFVFTVLSSCKKKLKSDSDEEVSLFLKHRNFKASANAFLSNDKYTSLVIELHYMKDNEPDATAIGNLMQFLNSQLRKPAGIRIFQYPIAPVKDTVLTHRQLYGIIKRNRTRYSSGNTMALYILYTNARYKNLHVMGQVFDNTSFVIHGRTIMKYRKVFSIPTQTTIETTLLLHEVGHILGLVNEGSPMQEEHADSLHEAHCINRDCIMYWATSVKPRFGPLELETIRGFCDSCKADLRANGGW